ncbi:ferrochelatase [Caulobacter sp. NIBR2454]|uniref:ferrochelatase n=1 Tax=Caulobacter sp. NIBR2454 TaxID=3015996 RepID=UPI0022B680B5|nr:ferrochelatase [Caulobacter sp. NIBR2454]
MSRKVAVVLMNLGGPDGPKAVRPFLFNLFRDRAIIGLPAIARYPLAALISTTRRKEATANYAIMGGGSPLLPETKAQADALELSLKARGVDAKCFIAMRYWHPFTEATARDVAAYEPDEVVLLPLYPQFSTTTTESSLKVWRKAYKGSGTVRTVCCYPTLDGLVEAHARKIRSAYDAAGKPTPARLLFSAHGLPQKVIDAGDPYQEQIEATAAAVAARLGAGWDWKVCYQSRVGPLKWLGPSTPEAIEEAASDGVGVVICPIAFVSEHVETLVELDHEYAELAEGLGISTYVRVPALGVEPAFIDGLAGLTISTLAGAAEDWTCEHEQGNCSLAAEGAVR